MCTRMQTLNVCALRKCRCVLALHLIGHIWAARYNTWLLIQLTPQGIVFSFRFSTGHNNAPVCSDVQSAAAATKLCLKGNCKHTIVDAQQTVLPWNCSCMPVLCHCHLYMRQSCRVTDTTPFVHSAAPWAAPTRPHAHAPEEQVGGGGCEDGVPGGMGL